MPFIFKDNIDNFIASLKQVFDVLFNWFKNNSLKNNVDKCHVLVSRNKTVGIKNGDYTIDNIECKKLLGIKIDANLNFNDYISALCRNASRKIIVLVRVTSFTGLRKRKLLINVFFTSQLSYCSLIWICHSHGNVRKTKRASWKMPKNNL